MTRALSPEPKIAAIYPYDPSSLARVRSLDTLRLLTGMGHVTVFAPALDEVACRRLREFGCKVVTRSDSFLSRMFRIVLAVLRARSISFAFYQTVAPNPAERRQFDLIFSERCIPPQDVEVPIIYDIVDNFESQVAQLARTAPFPKRYGYLYDSVVIRRDILEACARADIVLCTTPKEMESLARLGVKSTSVLPYLHQSQVQVPHLGSAVGAPPRTKPKRAVFHGRRSYPANQAAVERIRRQIMVRTPAWEYLVFGDGWRPSYSGAMRILGYQPDLRLLRTADAGVFPIAAAAGVQNKVLEALAAGLPVVVSPEVTVGMPKRVIDRLSDRIFVERIDRFALVLSEQIEHLSYSAHAESRFADAYKEVIEESREQLAERLRALLPI